MGKKAPRAKGGLISRGKSDAMFVDHGLHHSYIIVDELSAIECEIPIKWVEHD